MHVCFPHEQEGFLHLFLYVACCGQKHTHVPAPGQSKVTLLTSYLGRAGSQGELWAELRSGFGIAAGLGAVFAS